jgi:hypothetical protein
MKHLTTALAVLFILIALPFCTHDDEDFGPKTELLNDQVRVQVAFDANEVAFRYTWKSQKKLYPAGQGNINRNYPGHFHDLLKHNGTKFDRLPSAERMEEDRVTMMIHRRDVIQGYGTAGCAISCHTGMASHHLLTDDVLDHWHWRGARSGPMGYAEDAAVNNVERIRDNLGTPPSKWLRSAGDRLREDQAAMTGNAHPVLTDGLPRFVFNKGKTMPGNFVVPSFFIANEANAIVTNPHTGLPQITDLAVNRSLLVVYQDRAFDPVDKVNAIDLSYLVWLATDEVSHLPAHLQETAGEPFTTWRTFWAAETGINTAAAALTRLNDVHQEWVNSNRNAMVTRSVGFIYNSDQHDVRSERSFNASRNEWTVTLRRKLNTGSNRDADLSGLAAGTEYTLSFAMHDSGAGSETHDISMPMVLSTSAMADIQAKSVTSLNNVDWSKTPYLDTHWVKQSVMHHFYLDWLKSPSHPGAAVLETTSCGNCHKDNSSLLNRSVLQ